MFGMYVVVSKKMLVKFAGEVFVVGAVVLGSGVNKGSVAGLRRTCGGSPGSPGKVS